jgi:hypothetical protein
VDTRQGPVAATRGTTGQLVSFALDVLPSTRLPSGLYCHHRSFDDGALFGESVRYSLMVLLGLQRAEAAGHSTGVDLDELFGICLGRRASFSPGDLGLALWADARGTRTMASKLVDDIERAVPDDAALAPLAGMEIAWLLIGLCSSAPQLPAAKVTVRRLVAHLRRRRRAASGLYYHVGTSGLRRRLPNFATQIYTLLALARLGQDGLDGLATQEARRLGDHLLRLQLPDGGWPWLFDAEQATVVERYEIYSVHQDAMAPMALLEMTELTGNTGYRNAAVRGLGWSTGHNELRVNLLDTDAGFAHRSIRRRWPWSRLALAANSASALSVRRPVRLGGSAVALNRTCRPYHLGWILEAWAGREAAGEIDDV